MKLKYKTRRKLSLVILLIGLPLYILVVVTGLGYFVNIPTLIELIVYVFFGVIWIFPFKFIFSGVGQSEPKKDDPS